MTKLRLGLAGLASSFLLATPLQAATVVLGGYPDQLQFFDDQTGKVTDKVTLETGLPDNIQLSSDRKKIYVTTLTNSGIEVIDAATHKVLNKFSLNTPGTRYRFMGGVPDPSGRYFYTIGKRFDREADLFRVSKMQYMVIDLKTQQVARAIDLDEKDEEPGYRTRLAISPDGKKLYVIDKTVRIINTRDFSVAERIDLKKPDAPGMRDVTPGGSLEAIREPGKYISLFNAKDPYIHNEVFGIARFDLNSGTYTFDTIGPAPDNMDGLQVTPDGKDGYTVAVTGDLGNQRCEFWHFDLTTNTAVDKAEFPCRRRFFFGMSADGKKLYIYGAGYDVAVYDAKTLKHESDWELPNDITMAGIINLP